MVDFIRHPHTCYMRFYNDSAVKTKVRWQYAQQGAATLPFYTRFASGYIDQDKQADWQGIGQVPFGRLYFGVRPKVTDKPGKAPDGTAEQFAKGVSYFDHPAPPPCVLQTVPPGGPGVQGKAKTSKRVIPKGGVKFLGVSPDETMLPIQEVPTGAIDGVNQVFTLSRMPLNNEALLIFVNGLAQEQVADYTVTGSAVTFVLASTPRTGSNVFAFYLIRS